MQRLLKAIVVEDNTAVRNLIAHTLESDVNIKTATAHDLPEAVQLCRKEPQVVLIIDLGLPSCHDVEAIRSLKKEAPGATVVVITGQPLLEDAARRAGAHAVIIKGSPESIGDGFVKAVREAVVRHDVELLFAPVTAVMEKCERNLEDAKHESGRLSDKAMAAAVRVTTSKAASEKDCP
jgi:CheY-like chemotaxis protein